MLATGHKTVGVLQQLLAIQFQFGCGRRQIHIVYLMMAITAWPGALLGLTHSGCNCCRASGVLVAFVGVALWNFVLFQFFLQISDVETRQML